MVVVIRPASSDDVARLEQIESAADVMLIDLFAAKYWPPTTSGASRAAEPGFILIAATDAGGDAVGFAQVLEIDGAHLEQLAVVPAYGRQGIGRALVDAAKSETQRRGYDRLTLRTYADVPWNAPFYASCGFRETEPESGFHRQLVDTESRWGIDVHGRRVQMTALLT